MVLQRAISADYHRRASWGRLAIRPKRRASSAKSLRDLRLPSSLFPEGKREEEEKQRQLRLYYGSRTWLSKLRKRKKHLIFKSFKEMVKVGNMQFFNE